MTYFLPVLILAGVVYTALSVRNLKGIIMATAAEASAKLDQIGSTLDKVSAETTGLVQQVADLKAAAQASGNVPDDLMAKIDSLMGKAQSIDAMVDDVAPNPTETPDQPSA